MREGCGDREISAPPALAEVSAPPALAEVLSAVRSLGLCCPLLPYLEGWWQVKRFVLLISRGAGW
jgi:hypothetical protein